MTYGPSYTNSISPLAWQIVFPGQSKLALIGMSCAVAMLSYVANFLLFHYVSRLPVDLISQSLNHLRGLIVWQVAVGFYLSSRVKAFTHLDSFRNEVLLLLDPSRMALKVVVLAITLVALSIWHAFWLGNGIVNPLIYPHISRFPDIFFSVYVREVQQGNLWHSQQWVELFLFGLCGHLGGMMGGTSVFVASFSIFLGCRSTAVAASLIGISVIFNNALFSKLNLGLSIRSWFNSLGVSYLSIDKILDVFCLVEAVTLLMFSIIVFVICWKRFVLSWSHDD